MFHHVFRTPLGPIALIWNEQGLQAISWGEGSVREWSGSVAAQHGSSERRPPAGILPWKHSLLRYAGTGRGTFPRISLDSVSPFFARVYRELIRTEPGETVSYGELARRAGSPLAARAVGEAMRRNPFVIAVPCHRVVRAGRSLGAYSGPGGEAGKRRLLRLEGAKNVP